MKAFQLFAWACIATGSVLGARPLPSPVSLPSCPRGFVVSSDALWWQVSNPDLSFAIVDDRVNDFATPIGRQKRVVPQYKWGFRVAVQHGFFGASNDVLGRYLWYKATQVKEVAAPLLWPSVGVPGEALPLTDGRARARMRFRHQTGDLEFGQWLRLGCALDFRFHAGIRYAWIDHKFDADFFAANGHQTSRRNGEFFGFGPRLGMWGTFSLCGMIGLEGRGAAALLVGGERSRFSFLQDDAFTTDVRDPMKVRFVPNLEGSIGLYWRCCHQGIGFIVRAGYEIGAYINGVSRMQFFGDSSGVNTHQTSTFGLHGVYGGIAATY